MRAGSRDEPGQPRHPPPIFIQSSCSFHAGHAPRLSLRLSEPRSFTFVATGPICLSGTVSLVSEVIAPAFNVNALQQFVCDDNSGSFILRLHPQANGRPKEGFTLNGPWSVWGKGTGDYESLSGHGEFGVVLDFNSDPLEGEETYVGFVNL